MRLYTALGLVLILAMVLGCSRCNAQPAIEWTRSFGGSNWDAGYAVDQTTDGGYIISGYTTSSDGDVSGFQGSSDAWLIKLDSGGDMEWQVCLGGSSNEAGYDVIQTNEGGFAMVGLTNSPDGLVTCPSGASIDVWFVKLDPQGAIMWQRCFGGSSTDIGYSLVQCSDGGYAFTGHTWSNDGDVSGNNGQMDVWVVRLTNMGDIVWQRSLGGSSHDSGRHLIQTLDGGFLISGQSGSPGDGDVSMAYGGWDGWVVKLDANGLIEWESSLGGSWSDAISSGFQLSDGSYVLSVISNSFDGMISDNIGWTDYWLVKLDPTGNLEWETSLGGTDLDFVTFARPSSDGGFLLSGNTRSNDINVTCQPADYDVWLVKTDALGNIEWEGCLGGSEEDRIDHFQWTVDGGAILVGSSTSDDGDVPFNNGSFDVWVIKLPGIKTDLDRTIASTMTVWPNPVSDNAMIEFVAGSTPALLLLSDAQGRIVEKHYANEDPFTLPTGHLVPGVYILNVNSAAGSFIWRMIKE